MPNNNAAIIKPVDKDTGLDIDKVKITGINYPIFCFKHLQTKSIDGCRDADFFFRFLERLQKLSSLGWEQIRVSPRHSFGTEKIPTNIIKPNLPKFVTADVTHLTAFRANGNNLPFLGIQKGIFFHVIFIESKFGDIYDH